MPYSFRPHDPPGICQRCASKYHVSQLRKEWTGLLVCHGPGTNGCWEPRNAQDFVRGVRDRQRVHDASPEPADVFLTDFLEREDGTYYAREAGSTPINRES